MLRSVAVLLPSRVAPFELGVAAEVFGARRPAGDLDLPVFDYRLAACDPAQPVAVTGGGRLLVDHGLEALADADAVVVPALPLDEPVATMAPAGLDALRAARARGAWVMSLCTGAFVLGEAGLLDGRRATTHWRWAPLLAERYPAARVDPDVLYVEDDGVVTSAGTAAGVDACLHLVRTELGSDAATALARQLVAPPHRDGGQRQFVSRPVARDRAGELAELTDWLLDHLDQPHTLAGLADRAGLSERTLVRRFRQQHGTSALRWVTRQRVLRAQQLLETTDLDVEEVAHAVGLGGAALLRHHFTADVGLTPSAYRRRFRGERAS